MGQLVDEDEPKNSTADRMASATAAPVEVSSYTRVTRRYML